MKRIFLFLATNLAVLTLLSLVIFIIERVFGVHLAGAAWAAKRAEAVLGHEITHVANGDMVTLVLLQGVLNTFDIFLARIIGSVSADLAGTGCTNGFMHLTHPPIDEHIAALQHTP